MRTQTVGLHFLSEFKHLTNVLCSGFPRVLWRATLPFKEQLTAELSTACCQPLEEEVMRQTM